MPLDLNEEQAQAVALIRGAIEAQKYTGFLLNGVTGSGKTEVYLQAMQTVLETDKQVLILVPEIGLTPQTKACFAQRFAARILLLLQFERHRSPARLARLPYGTRSNYHRYSLVSALSLC